MSKPTRAIKIPCDKYVFHFYRGSHDDIHIVRDWHGFEYPLTVIPTWMFRYAMENCVEKPDHFLLFVEERQVEGASLWWPVAIEHYRFDELYELAAYAPTVKEMIKQKGIEL